MVPSRLAFLQEFERDLDSISLRHWFETARKREPVLNEFIDSSALRGFLQTEERDPLKPQVWRALIRSFQTNPEPSRLFVLGLLEPALGHLMDRFAGDDLDAEDLWQETITCAVAALSNPKLAKRTAVLMGILLDTFSGLRHWLRDEFAQGEETAPLPEQLSSSLRSKPRARLRDELVLAKLCRRAGVDREGFAVLRVLLLWDQPLTMLAPAGSARYQRLRRRGIDAEARLKCWLSDHPDWVKQSRSHRLA